jgi:hypothetical protein
MIPSVLLPHRRRILGEVDQEADQWSMLVVTPVMGYSLLFSCGRLNAFDPYCWLLLLLWAILCSAHVDA